MEIYEIFERHKLVPEGLVAFLDLCKSMSRDARVVRIADGQDVVAEVIVSGVVDHEGATVEFIPVPRFFHNGDASGSSNLRMAMDPVLADLFMVHQVRRVTSLVTQHRNKTRTALKALGFKHEGGLEDGVQLRGRDPETLMIYGMTRKRYLSMKKEVRDVAA